VLATPGRRRTISRLHRHCPPRARVLHGVMPATPELATFPKLDPAGRGRRCAWCCHPTSPLPRHAMPSPSASRSRSPDAAACRQVWCRPTDRWPSRRAQQSAAFLLESWNAGKAAAFAQLSREQLTALVAVLAGEPGSSGPTSPTIRSCGSNVTLPGVSEHLAAPQRIPSPGRNDLFASRSTPGHRRPTPRPTARRRRHHAAARRRLRAFPRRPTALAREHRLQTAARGARVFQLPPRDFEPQVVAARPASHPRLPRALLDDARTRLGRAVHRELPSQHRAPAVRRDRGHARAERRRLRARAHRPHGRRARA